MGAHYTCASCTTALLSSFVTPRNPSMATDWPPPGRSEPTPWVYQHTTLRILTQDSAGLLERNCNGNLVRHFCPLEQRCSRRDPYNEADTNALTRDIREFGRPWI